MREWKEDSLERHIKIKHGYAFKGKFISEIPNNNVLLTPGNFNIGGGFKSDKYKYYYGEIPDDYILNEDDIIVTMTDLSKTGDTLGYSAKIPSNGKFNFLHNQRIGLVKFISQELYEDYIYWLMRTKHYQKSIVNSSTGSTVSHTSPSRIGEYLFRYPPKEEQIEIAKTLSILDEKINLLRDQNETLEQLAQTLFNRWFVDFEFPNEEGKSYKSSGGKMVESELGEIPEGWIVEEFGYFVKHSTSSVNPGTYPAENFTHYSIPAFDKGAVPFLEVGETILSNKYVVKENCILVSKLNPSTPRIWPVFKPGNRPVSSTEIQVFKPKEGFYSFTYGLLHSRSIKKEMIQRASGTSSSHQRVRPGDILNIEAVVPPVKLINHFENGVLPLLKKADKNKLEIESLTKLRDTLLPKLINGELRINF